MKLERTYKTATGETINLNDGTLEHLRAHPEAGELLGEAIALVKIAPVATFVMQTLDMGRIIGHSGLIEAPEVRPDETATFALRLGRDIPSRVVVGVEKPETELFTVLAYYHAGDKQWNLITGFAGPGAPKEPTDRSLVHGNEAELKFWCRHALVHEEEWGEPFESTWNQVVEDAIAARAEK